MIKIRSIQCISEVFIKATESKIDPCSHITLTMSQVRYFDALLKSHIYVTVVYLWLSISIGMKRLKVVVTEEIH